MKWLIRQVLVRWLRERALVLPAKKREEIARRLRIDITLVAAIEQAIRDAIIEEVSG